MSIVYGPNVGLMAGAADGDLYGDAMRAFQRGVDSFLMPTVDGYLINTPPASPVEGSFYIIGAAPSGDWAGHAGEMARWSSHVSDWDFYTPKNGWMAQSKNARESYRYTGGAWEIYYQEGTWTPEPSNLGGTGIDFPVASFTRSGRIVHFIIKITGTGLTSTASVTSLSLSHTPAKASTCCASEETFVSNYGVGIVLTNGRVYTPSIASTTSATVTGTFFI